MLWDGLDFMDKRPGLKLGLVIGVPLAALAIGAAFWGHSRWSKTHASETGLRWLAAGRLDRAGISSAQALRDAPSAPQSWQLAADLAWRKGMKAQAVNDLRSAALLSRDSPDAVIAWAEAAVLAGEGEEAGRALALLAPDGLLHSARAQRVKGEWLRRRGAWGEAAACFRAAGDLDRRASARPLAINEIPLGVTLLSSGGAGDRERGVALLARWAPDPSWGAQALRALLGDALRRGDRTAMARLAGALSRHPRFTVGDVPDCLRGCVDSDPQGFQAMVRAIEKESAGNAPNVADIMGSLNRLGRTEETLAWAKAIPPAVSRRPPIAVAVAEALRLGGRWRELGVHADRCEWGHNLEFLGSLYGMMAARHVGDTARAQAFWRTLQSASTAGGGQTLVAADLLYGWGTGDEAIELLWGAAANPGVAVQALGTLARIYQVRRDADGQYRAFSRMASLRPDNRDIGNNFAYFAAVTGRAGVSSVQRIAQSNFEATPGNPTYRSTWAFVLCQVSKPGEAMTVLQPIAPDWRKSRAVAWAYGASLAGLGRKDEAREVLGSLDPGTLTFQEIAWVRSVLR
jgi:Tfp pilus assembly protein PilF